MQHPIQTWLRPISTKSLRPKLRHQRRKPPMKCIRLRALLREHITITITTIITTSKVEAPTPRAHRRRGPMLPRARGKRTA